VNISALPELLLSWVKNQGAALLQGDKAPASTFQAGQQYEGKVIDSLANGRHLVRVNSQLLDMNLPAKTQTGDNVRLTFVNAGLRPTFLLNQAPVGAVQQVRISNTAQQVNALLRLAQTPTAAATSTTSTASNATPALSREAGAMASALTAQASSAAVNAQTTAGASTGRPIVANVSMLQSFTAAVPSTTATLTGSNTGLLGQAIDAPRASVAASTTLSANTLVELPGAARNMLPVRLAQTLSESGLFYESHLAKWSRGTMSIEAILREPQARLAATAQVSLKMAELAGMPEEAARLAGRQLQILEGGPFLWQGIAWPGQNMQWLIREESAEDNQGETDENASEWVTELNLILPRMGEVHAQLGLNGDRLRVRLLADDADTRASLEAALPLLVKGFEANGLQAFDMRVEAAIENSAGNPSGKL